VRKKLVRAKWTNHNGLQTNATPLLKQVADYTLPSRRRKVAETLDATLHGSAVLLNKPLLGNLPTWTSLILTEEEEDDDDGQLEPTQLLLVENHGVPPSNVSFRMI